MRLEAWAWPAAWRLAACGPPHPGCVCQLAAGLHVVYMVGFQAGGGVVADSDPAAEYQETVNKASALLKAVALSEQL